MVMSAKNEATTTNYSCQRWLLTTLVLICIWIFVFFNSERFPIANIPVIPYLQSQLSFSKNDTISHAYSIWLEPPDEIKKILDDEINKLASTYNTSILPAHVSLYGPIITSNISYVQTVSNILALKLSPMKLIPSHVEIKKYNVKKRWPGGISLRYSETQQVMAATRIASLLFRARDQLRPHTTLLLDYDGVTANKESMNATIWNNIHQKVEDLTWTAKDIHIWYTPMRNRWRNHDDMKFILNQWRKVATISIKIDDI